MRRWLLTMALMCVSCDPKYAKALLDALGPFACHELQSVTDGNRIVGVACPAAKAVLDALLTDKLGTAPVEVCDKHFVVLDKQNQRVALLCESPATKLAAAVGGKVVAP